MKTKVKASEVQVGDRMAYRGQWLLISSAVVERNEVITILGWTDDYRQIIARLSPETWVYKEM